MGGGRSAGLVLVAAMAIAVVSTGGVQADLSSADGDGLHSLAGVVGPPGYSMVSGDFNGDGYADLAIGNRSDWVGDQNSAGTISLVWGSATGLDWAGAENFHQNTPGVDGVAEAGDWFGEELAVGNFDGDCCDDLAVGTKREALEGNSVENAGWVQVFSGTPSGLDFDDYAFDQETPGGWPAANEELDWFGDELTTGDFDADGYDDLAVGVRYEDIGPSGSAVEDAGAVVVVFGTSGGLDIGHHQVLLHDPLVIDGQFSYEMAAIPSAGGDLLAVASLRPSTAGSLELYSGLDAGASSPTVFPLDPIIIERTQFPLRYVGSKMAVGDFDGDGKADLLARAGNATEVGDGEQRPEDPMFVLSGPFGVSGPAAVEMLTLESPGVERESFPSDAPYYSLGGRMAVGDFDADGIDDVVTSIFGSGSAAGFGLVWYGAPGGLSGTGSHVIPFDRFEMAAGDFDGDEYGDYAAAASGDSGTEVFVRHGTYTPGRIDFGHRTNSWEHLGEVRMEVVRSGRSDGPVQATIVTGPVGSTPATPGEDYTPIEKVLKWADSETGSKWVTIPIALDGFAEQGEAFEVRMIDVTPGVPHADGTWVGLWDSDIEPLEPARVLETRSGEKTIDGLFQGGGANPAGEVLKVRIAGRGGVPVGASAALVNLTAIRPDRAGFATLFPCTDKVPTASTLNYVAGDIVANGALAKLDQHGDACIYTLATTHLLIDVTGFVPTGSDVVALPPGRIFDGRLGEKTIDGVDAGAGPIAAGEHRKVKVTGRAGVPPDAAGVFLNVTSVRPPKRGFITAYPCTDQVPTASNVNYIGGDVVANGVFSQLSDDGYLCFYSHQRVNLVVDVVGYETSHLLASFEPVRVFESRPGEKTFDGQFQGVGALRAGVPVEIPIGGRLPGTGDERLAIFANVVVISPSAQGFLTLYPCTDEAPTASTVNFVAGDVVANNAFAKLTVGESMCVVSLVDTHVAIDVSAASILT